MVLLEYMESTVVTTVDTMTVPLTEVFFPSVVVCNINQVRSSFFEEIGAHDEEVKLRLYQDYILGQKLNKEIEKENPSIEKISKIKLTPKLEYDTMKLMKDFFEK